MDDDSDNDDILKVAEQKLTFAECCFQLAPQGEHRFVCYMNGVQYSFQTLKQSCDFIKACIDNQYNMHLELQSSAVKNFSKHLANLKKIKKAKSLTYTSNKSLQESQRQFEKLSQIESDLRKKQEALLQEYKNAYMNEYFSKFFELDLSQLSPAETIQKNVFHFLDIFLANYLDIKLRRVDGFIPDSILRRFPTVILKSFNCGFYECNLNIYEINLNDSMISSLSESEIKKNEHVSKTHRVHTIMQFEQTEKIGETGYLLGKVMSEPEPFITEQTNSSYAYQLIDDIREHILLLEKNEQKYKTENDKQLTRAKKNALRDLIDQLDEIMIKNKMNQNSRNSEKVKNIIDTISRWKRDQKNQMIGEHINPILYFLRKHTIFDVKTKTEKMIDKIIEKENNALSFK